MSKVKTILDEDDFRVDLELEGEYLFVHCHIKTWAPSVLKKLRLGFNELKQMAYLEGYDNLYTYTGNNRWCKLLDDNFKHISDITVLGQDYEVLGWGLKQD